MEESSQTFAAGAASAADLHGLKDNALTASRGPSVHATNVGLPSAAAARAQLRGVSKGEEFFSFGIDHCLTNCETTERVALLRNGRTNERLENVLVMSL